MKAGTQVTTTAAPVGGVVLRRRVNELTDELEALVEYTDANGDVQQRWFEVEKLAATPAVSQGDAQ